jgi:hypothetical protein
MRNPAIGQVQELERLMVTRPGTTVIATGPDGRAHRVDVRHTGTSEFPAGTVHHFGPVAFLEETILISQLDTDTGVITLIHVDGTATTLQVAS